MKVHQEFKMGSDGLLYSVRYLLTDEELQGLQAAGVISDVTHEIIGMQTVVDTVMAGYERDVHTATGGALQ